MMGKIISFAGIHSTGKTAAVLEFAGELKKKAINAWPVFDVARTTRLPINDKGTWLSQEVIAARMMVRQLEAAAANQIVITDRTPLDCLAYNLANGVSEDDPEYIRLKDMVYNYVRRHNRLILRLGGKNTGTAHDDGVRPTSGSFHENSAAAFDHIYNSAELDLHPEVEFVHIQSDFFDSTTRRRVFDRILSEVE